MDPQSFFDAFRQMFGKSRCQSRLALLVVLNSCVRTPTRVDDAVQTTVIERVTLIDGTGDEARGPVDVVVRDGRIAQISDESLALAGATAMAAAGLFLVPGLIDAHTHPFPVEETFPQFIRFGVTSILVTGCSDCDDATLIASRESTMRPGAAAPRFFHTSQHFSMEGRHPEKTYPSPKWRDGETIHFIDSVEEIGPLVERVTKLPIVGLKLTIEDGPAPPIVERMPQPFVDEVVAQAHARGTPVLAHVSDMEELRMAHSAGVDHLLHFVGVDIDWSRDRPMLEELLARDVHWVTTLMIDKSFLYPLHPEWIAAVRGTGLYDAELDRLAASDPPQHQMRALIETIFGSDDATLQNPTIQKELADLRQLHEMGFHLVVGTDVGNRYVFPGYSVHEEMELLESGGIPPAEVLVMATQNAARLLNASDEIGTLEVGKRADMVLLRSDPRQRVSHLRAIQAVFRDGRVVFSE